MSMISVDARGRACPEPVILVKKALADRSARYEVLVDNQTAVENITRYASTHGWKIEATREGEDYRLLITG